MHPVVSDPLLVPLTPSDQFIVACLPIAARMARRRAHEQALWADLFQEACLALVEVVRSHAAELALSDPAHLQALAIIWMRRRIALAAARHRAGAYSLPDHALRDWVQVRQAARHFAEAQGRAATVAELATLTQLPTNHIARLLRATLPTITTDEAQPFAAPPATDAQAAQLRQLVTRLPEPERTIIIGQFGLGGPHLSARVLATRLHCSYRHLLALRQHGLLLLRAWLLVE